MKTYLILWFTSNGENPLIIMERLMDIGFKPIIGQYDLEYDHEHHVSIEDIMELLVQVHETLHGTTVLYRLETVT